MRRLDEAGPRRERHFADRFWSGCRAPIRFRYNDCMRRWELTVALDPGKDHPLFLQLATAIADDIRRGRLQPGDPLPGTRELARSLGLNRNTVVAGYDELLAEGLVRTRTGGGTFVADPVPSPAAPAPALAEAPTYPLAPALKLPPLSGAPLRGMLTLSGVPDVRLLPATALARAFRHAIGYRGRALLTYADPRGHVRLRAELSTISRTRGLPVTPSSILVTRSIEQAIDLVARTLLRPGDVVAVESFGYPPAWSVLQLAGARLVPVPLDAEGLQVDALEKLVRQQPVRAVFVSPHHQFPTGAVMSVERRARLAELALQHGFAIIEDDYDHEFHYEGKPLLPIAAGAGRANVIYVGSLFNLLAPGLCTGFVAAPPPVMQRLVGLRAASDAQGDAAVECAIAELFEEGELLRHVRRMRRIYAGRRDALASALWRQLGSALQFEVPDGGMAIWARADDAIDVSAWARAGEREGVMFSGSRDYDFFHRPQPFLRLGFTYHDESELQEAVRRMSRALARTGRTTAAAAAAAAGQRFAGHADTDPPTRKRPAGWA